MPVVTRYLFRNDIKKYVSINMCTAVQLCYTNGMILNGLQIGLSYQ